MGRKEEEDSGSLLLFNPSIPPPDQRVISLSICMTDPVRAAVTVAVVDAIAIVGVDGRGVRSGPLLDGKLWTPIGGGRSGVLLGPCTLDQFSSSLAPDVSVSEEGSLAVVSGLAMQFLLKSTWAHNL